MTDDPNVSPSGLYAFAECEVVDMRNGGALLIDRHSDAQLLVAPPVANSMQMCREFRTLEQHTDILTRTIPELGGQQADVMNVFDMLRGAGLLITAESVCAKLNAQVPPPLDLPPTRVFILTCDRPKSLERLLESMLRAGNMTRHEALFLIDDSRDPEAAALNRAAVEKFNLTCPRSMNYLGADEAESIMAAMIELLPDQEEAIRFLIDRKRWADKKSYGLARNLSLLLSVGCRAIVMDDDVVCAAVAAPHHTNGIQFGHQEREVEFYQNEGDLLAQTSRSDFDPLSGHALCLGLSMGQATTKLKNQPLEPQDLEGASSTYLNLWDANSPVIITQTGSMGDPGSESTSWIYTLNNESSRRLMNFSGGLEGALRSRCYWMGQPRPQFTKMSVMSQVIGLDNTKVLPPYFPVFRGEDYLFGAMTEYVHPNSAVLEYDWSVPHLPLESRIGDPAPAPLSGKSKINVNEYITDRTVYAADISAETRLTSLANILLELSETSDRGLISEFRKAAARSQASDFALVNSRIQDEVIRAPAMQDWLVASAEQLSVAMQKTPLLTEYFDTTDKHSDTDILDAARQLLGGFSDAISHWESIRKVAADIAEENFNNGRFTV